MGPMFLRTLLSASAWGEGRFGYNVAEYHMVNGIWKKEEVLIDDTLMRIEEDGRQFETYIRGWELTPKSLWLKDFELYLAVRQRRGYVSGLPMPVF